jgi:xanthine dehydrogenase iron-sulfur cluster and FAD-binding subunit A
LISLRREDDIAIVNAGMRVLLEKDPVTSTWVVAEAAVAYGGVAARAIMAKEVRHLAAAGIVYASSHTHTLSTCPAEQKRATQMLQVTFITEYYLTMRPCSDL